MGWRGARHRRRHGLCPTHWAWSTDGAGVFQTAHFGFEGVYALLELSDEGVLVFDDGALLVVDGALLLVDGLVLLEQGEE